MESMDRIYGTDSLHVDELCIVIHKMHMDTFEWDPRDQKIPDLQKHADLVLRGFPAVHGE